MDWCNISLFPNMCSFQLKTLSNKKGKNTLRVEINRFYDGLRDTMRSSYASTKCEGLSYTTHFLKSRVSVIRNNFLEYRTKQVTLFFATK